MSVYKGGNLQRNKLCAVMLIENNYVELDKTVSRKSENYILD
jgi:hypothetical protein